MGGLAIFGGTFDPIHNAHVTVARAAAERFALERILFVPSARPPHRRFGPFASYEDRFQMVALACQDDARFEASRLECGPEISYSIHTIERASAAFFLIGADAFADLPTWHRYRDVIQAVTFIVVSRPGAQYEIPDGAKVERLEDVSLAISSSEVRRELAVTNASAQIPAVVANYIREHHLYASRQALAY